MQKCYMYDRCNRKDCESDFCIRKYKMDSLYSAALMTENQKQHIALRVDADGTDLEQFKQLACIEQNINKFIEEGKNLYLHSAIPGNGKAQPDNALVLTKNGYAEIKDLAIGEDIYGEDGKLHQVIGKFDRGVKSIYKVYFHDGTSTECCNEHLWTVIDHKDKTTKTVTLDDIIATGMSFGSATDSRWRYDIPITKAVTFEQDNSLLIDPYLLGYLLGDGHLSKVSAISFSVHDSDAPETIAQLSSLVPNGCAIVKASSKYNYNIKLAEHNGIKKTFGTFNNPLKQLLKSYSLLDTNSYTKFIPKDFLFASIEHRIALVQGLMDTDGTVSVQKKGGCSLFYSTASAQLAKDFASLVESLGGTCSVRERKGKSYMYKGEKRYGNPWYSCYLKLPKDSFTPFRLSRKAELYNSLRAHQQREPYRSIRAIEYVGDKHAYCIMTNNPTHLYLTNNFIVTHNTSWTLRLVEAYFNKIWARSEPKCRALFISVPRFLLALKDNITNKSEYVEYIKENVLEADLVVFDDLGSKIGSEFELSHLLSIIDNRLSLGKSNIYTSNLNRQQLYTALGERLTSRVANMSIDIELFGSDKRNLKLEDN